jgi:signal transduction histidine kinase/ActR/RegA family two-component response regulator
VSPPPAGRPLRRLLIVLALAGILPLTLLCGVGLMQLYRQQHEEAHRRVVELSRAVAIAVDLELQRSLAAVTTLASIESLRRGDLPSFEEAMRRTAAAQVHWNAVILARADGMAVLHSRVPAGGSMPAMVESPSFTEAVRARRPLVGDLARGPSGGYAFPVRAPVIAGDEVLYVVTAVVSPEAILEIVRRQSVPDDWTLAVLDSTGARVARNRGNAQYIGQPLSEPARKLMAETAGDGMAVTKPVDGGEAFTAFSRLPSSGWAVAISIPVEAVDRAAWRTVEAYGAAVIVSLVVGLLAVLAVASRINQPIARLRDGALVMGDGGQPAPIETGVREIDEVGRAMARAGAQRLAYEQERERFLSIERDARNEAEEASRGKDRFLAMLAHELRNPLAALSNAASLLRLGGADARVSANAGEVIQRQVAHLARLTDDLLEAARALLGKTQLHLAAVNLATVVSQVMETLQSTGRTAGHAVQLDLRDAWVHADGVRLDQVVTNLVVNAVKYTPEGGTLRVSTWRAGPQAMLSVADDGTGIAPELAGRVFDLFVQGERALDRSAGGLGIGLTLVRRLAELHGGTAEVRSEGEGKGSEFIVRLPAIDAPPRPEPRSEAKIEAIPRRILVVEDNDDARETLKQLLEIMGHRVAAAANGLAGLDRALEFLPDVAFVDLGLPGIDGYEVARRLRASPSGGQVYLVALTGYGAEEDRRSALEAGFDAHATKPVEPERLAALIAQAAVASQKKGAP